MASFADLTLEERLKVLEPKSCRPLPDAKVAIAFAVTRFHESWHPYRTVTPTLYLLREEGQGVYVTLGKMRRGYGLSRETLDAALEALTPAYGLHGFLLASEAVGGEPPRLLFGLQGHEHGEKHYGGLELSTLTPFEAGFSTEFDLSADAWQDARLQASNS